MAIQDYNEFREKLASYVDDEYREFSMKGIKIFPKKKKIFSLDCLRGWNYLLNLL